jgi:hypothetical protein
MNDTEGLARAGGETISALPAFRQRRALVDMEMLAAEGTYTRFHAVEGLWFDGDLNIEILEKSLCDIVERHGALRTGFGPNPDLTSEERATRLRTGRGFVLPSAHLQFIKKRAILEVQFEDLSKHCEEDRQRAIGQVLEREYARQFDLGTPPLMRVTLLRAGQRHHLLVIITHHLVTDMLSQRILRKEIAAFYADRIAGHRNDLLQSATQFSDFCRWEWHWLRSPAFASRVARLREQWLTMEVDQLRYSDLPFSLPPSGRPPGKAFDSIEIERETALRLNEVARHFRITLPSLFLSSLAICLARWTGKKRFPVWINLANREQLEFQSAFGWFAGTRFICVDLAHNEPWIELFRRVNGTLLDAVEHQNVPLDLVWRSLGRLPLRSDLKILFDFVKQGSSVSLNPDSSDGVTMNRMDFAILRKLGTPVGLEFVVAEEGGRITLAAGYYEDRILRQGVRQMLEQLRKEVANLTTRSTDLR